MEDPVVEPLYDLWCVLSCSHTHLPRETVRKGEQHPAETRQFCFSVERKMQYIEKQGFSERKTNVCVAVLHDFFCCEFSIFSF